MRTSTPHTIQSGNSLVDAALIGGALLASRIREEFPSIRITELDEGLVRTTRERYLQGAEDITDDT